MLERDPKKRITAAECLEHGYFDGVKSAEADYDYVEENDDITNLDDRMSKMNEEYRILIILELLSLT